MTIGAWPVTKVGYFVPHLRLFLLGKMINTDNLQANPQLDILW